MEGYKYIFDDAEKIYKNNGSSLANFRKSRDIYGFCINIGSTDQQALDYAKNINNNLYNLFINQPKGLTGYNGFENEYVKIDDNDSKHILLLTYLFDKSDLSFNKIVEIGGGFGNMCRLCKNIVNFNTWDIIDLPHMLELQKFYLENEIKDILNINFINAHSNINYNDKIELVIATHSLSEFSWDIFIKYFNDVILKSKYFYFGYNKNCPSPDLINMKITHILNNGFTCIKNFDYVEKPHGANVSYKLLVNNTF